MKFLLDFKKPSNEESARKSIVLTEEAAKLLSQQLKGKERFIDRLNSDGNFEETIDKYTIAGIRPAQEKESTQNDTDMSAVCEYGTRHPHRGKLGFEECNCYEKFNKISPFHFEKLVRKYYPKVEYSVDITPEMQSFMKTLKYA